MTPLSPRLRTACLAAALAVTGAAAWAADPVQQHNSSAVWFENWTGLSNAMMTVIAPDGTITTVQAERGTPVFELPRGAAPDGVYRYELRAATEERVEIVNRINSGREDEGDGTMAKPFYTTGHFVVERGAIITPEDIKEEEGR